MSTTTPKTDNKAPAAPAEAPALHAKLLKQIADTPIDDRTSGEKQIHRACMLEAERANVGVKIAANRTYLRLMDENEELEPDEADFLADFYADKEKGATRSDDELERTRKVKAAARAYAKK